MKLITFSVLSLILAFNALTINAQQEVENLKTFARAYGYVKYFHPSNEAANLDWNTFSAYGVNEILQCKSQKEVVTTLKDLFQPIGPGIQFTEKENDYDLSRIIPSNLDSYKPTYWQHTGVSFGMSRSDTPYSSVRANQTRKIDESASFGNLSTSINAEQYRGKEIKYTGWVKLKDQSKGQGQLWMRVDKSDGTMGYFNNMGSSPIKSNEWSQYEIIGQVDELASKILIGCFMNGKGTVYLDDVELYFKDKEEWIEIPIKNNEFEGDQIGDKTDKSPWYGKSKGYSYTLSGTEKKSGKSCAVIAYEGLTTTLTGEATFEQFPKFGELIVNQIGKNIYCQIPLNLYGNAEHTYPISTSIDRLNENITSFEIEPNNQSAWIGNVINAYNVFQHFYPYFDVVDVNWDQELESAIHSSLTDQTLEDHILTLKKFTATLKDGHISVRGNNPKRHGPSISWEWIEDKLVITQVYDKSLNLSIGDIVTRVDNIPSNAYIQEISTRISAGTQGYLQHRLKSMSLLGTQDSKIEIHVNGESFTLTRDRKFDYRTSGIAIQENEYKILDNNIVYLNLSKIKMDSITSLMPKLEESNGIICDLRGYPQSNHDLISHLLPAKDTSMSWMQVPKIIYPDQKNIIGYEEHGWEMEPKTPYLGDKNLVFITDGRAISYAESFMGFIEGYDLATIVGQPTAGTNGNVNPYKLLHDITLVWTGMKVLKHDGSQHHAIGILPDVSVSKTIEGVKAGKDEFLEKAIEVIMDRSR